MKNEVTVNGVKLTRQQVEEALAELNTPEVKRSKLRPGSRVRRGSREYTVCDSSVSNVINRAYGFHLKDPVTVINQQGGSQTEEREQAERNFEDF